MLIILNVIHHWWDILQNTSSISINPLGESCSEAHRTPFMRSYHGPLSRITAQVCAGLSFMGTLPSLGLWRKRLVPCILVCIWRTNRVNYWYLERVSHRVIRWRSRCETTCTPNLLPLSFLLSYSSHCDLFFSLYISSVSVSIFLSLFTHLNESFALTCSSDFCPFDLIHTLKN